jgi:hypothetical protein
MRELRSRVDIDSDKCNNFDFYDNSKLKCHLTNTDEAFENNYPLAKECIYIKMLFHAVLTF